MRKIEYLSPSAISLWMKDREAYYLQYLAEHRPPRDPQNRPMAAGSAFDAYVKAYLHKTLFGEGTSPKHSFEALFEAQVEPQNRDWARQVGAHCFEQYRSSGALTELLLDMRQASSDPRFEFEVRGTVTGQYGSPVREPEEMTIGNVTLLGKPDASYVNKAGMHVILDWKVNGYCSNYPKSPDKGYVKLRTAGGTSWPHHGECVPMMVGGMLIDGCTTLEERNEDWARQLAIYAWLCGEPVGGEFVVAIDQLACSPVKNLPGAPPSIKVASHRCKVGTPFQLGVFKLACDIWRDVHSGWFFRDMTEEDSIARCNLLEQRAASLFGSGIDPDLLRRMSR